MDLRSKTQCPNSEYGNIKYRVLYHSKQGTCIAQVPVAARFGAAILGSTPIPRKKEGE